MKRPAILLVVALLLFSCGGGSDDESATETVKEPTTTTGEESSAELEGKLLTVSDLPSGYAVSQDDDDDDSSSNFCDGKFDLLDRYPPEAEAEVEFQKEGPDALSGNLVAEFLGEYSTSDAEAAFAGAQSAVQECKNFEQTDPENGTTISGTLEPLQFPAMGDQTLAVKMNGQIKVQSATVPLVLEVVIVREGGTVMGVANAGLGSTPVNSTETTEIAETAYQKLI